MLFRSTLYFDRLQFAYFDCFILKRNGAEHDYTPEELAQLAEMDKIMSDAKKNELIENIIVKTQGFVNGNITEDDKHPVKLFKALLAQYDGIDKQMLRDNMVYFLKAIMPVCQQYDIRMCVHPDDPPFQVLGLPRIVTNADDIEWILNAVDNPCNGLTFCAGSLSAELHNDVPAMARRFAQRSPFVHLR